METMLRVAQGETLPWTEDLTPKGWSIECRINAEDPANQFAPSPGTLERFSIPEAPYLRVDTAMEEGRAIPPFYDSLLAKLIVHGEDRADAIAKMLCVLNAITIEGVKTTLPLQKAIIASPVFQAGKLDTAYIESHMEEFVEN